MFDLPLTVQLGALHSGLEPQQKSNLLRRFNSGKLRALLLTDAFGLGLDFQEVDVVLSVSPVRDLTPTFELIWASVTPADAFGLGLDFQEVDVALSVSDVCS